MIVGVLGFLFDSKTPDYIQKHRIVGSQKHRIVVKTPEAHTRRGGFDVTHCLCLCIVVHTLRVVQRPHYQRCRRFVPVDNGVLDIGVYRTLFRYHETRTPTKGSH